ncbi:hypothetical protein PACTADRAFT_67009 [Pachysolen tannophilus NRRL Y-2460]|uniref:Actin cytoskeleton-regulatory complex protein END3 n=1 Tax=Pachysolen tannophilus NRRL Y-2460 TaxID=669874 RepID=A0A1E4TW38_PACTA|nr:hypothetical protein PACTADRAFT_67009 [Pachysolen tannophilus NRRL Y-2460]
MSPKLEEWEIKKYWEIFSGLKPVNNKLSGDKVKQIFNNSKLPQDKLTKIWDLSDIDTDGSLDFEEFCIAMRLIFDSVNGNISSIPDSLPDWLVPGSKAHLVQADKAISSGNNNYPSSDEDDDLKLSDNFEWYISPTDKSTYESVYTTSSDRFGRVTFDSLDGLYKTLGNVPRTDISSAWNIVNPKQYETIDKDQCLVFLHILNQRSNGKRIPRNIPASLRATFSRETPDYDINSHQGDIRRPTSLKNKHSFADDYLNRITPSGTGSINGVNGIDRGTDFESTKDTDWDEVRLRRKLKDLENLISKAEEAAEKRRNPRIEDDKIGLTKYEFEQLLKYKESQLAKISTSNGSNGSTGGMSNVKSDIDDIEQQVATLEQFLKTKKTELINLQNETTAS